MITSLSVVIPAFNEGPRIERTLEQLLDYLKRESFSWEVWVVDDGSTDETASRVQVVSEKEPGVALIRHPVNRGKGAAVRTGLSASRGEAVLFYDADGATPIEELKKLLPHLEQGGDLVTGTRYNRQSQVLHAQKRLRRFMGSIYRGICIRWVTPGITDVTCGFKLLSRRAVDLLLPRLSINRWSFDAEIFTIARSQNLKLVEVPIRWVDQRKSKVRFRSDVWGSLMELFKIWWNKHRGAYP